MKNTIFNYNIGPEPNLNGIKYLHMLFFNKILLCHFVSPDYCIIWTSDDNEGL